MSGQTLTLDDYREFPASQKFVPDEHQTYTYDELDRLKTVSKTFVDGYTGIYTYTATGNLTGKTESGTMSYTYPANGQPRPHAATQAGSNSYTYNANGDMLTRTESGISYTQQWDSENRLKVVTNTTANPDIITTFFYNGDDARVKKTEQVNTTITTTFYAGPIEVLSTTQLITKTYYNNAGGQMIAMREVTNTTGAGTLTYLHSDHLGSTSVTTCGNSACGTLGAVLVRQSYYPYGGVRVAGNLPTDITFTGQRSDATGLMHFGARYYSSLLGRFVSADTIIPGGGPQSLNRYSYVGGNPLKYTDPTGHTKKCGIGCDEGNWSYTLAHFGIKLTGNMAQWTVRNVRAVIDAATAIGLQFSQSIGGSAAEAFQAVYNIKPNDPMILFWGNQVDPQQGVHFLGSDCIGIGSGGCTTSPRLINFMSLSRVTIEEEGGQRDAAEAFISARNNVVHEMGHAFTNRWKRDTISGPYQTAVNSTMASNEDGFYPFPPGDENARMWRQHPFADGGDKNSEILADMFLGWTFDKWANDAMGARRDMFMTTNMTQWIAIAAGHE